ncbi:MAG TPA: alpha/beta hydrolase [Kofleriaceae bacterium]|nr:alpha/beta hydrolase [Kofleriaceae bacterium]
MGRYVALMMFLSACGGSGSSSSPDAAGSADAAAPTVTLNQACTDTYDQIYADPTGLPAFDASHRGDVFRCGRDRYFDAASLDAITRLQGYTGAPLTSGVTMFRLAYRTERAVGEGHSAAILFVPDHPRNPSALVVYAHASAGVAPQCGPSRFDITTHGDWVDTNRAPLLALVGAGFTVIMPDFAGYGFGDAAPGYASAEDEAKSVLDATRAAKQLIPDAIRPTKVVLVGHSMGGHAVLSAHAMLSSYGADGDVIGVVGLAPFWISNLAWGALMSADQLGYTTTNASYMLEYQLDYYYGHGELIDGAGHGLDLIQPGKRAAVSALLASGCLGDVADGMHTLGTYPSDYFDATAVDSLSKCGFNDDCTTAPATTWGPRFIADRPAIAADGPPIALWYGGADTTISPAYAQCTDETLAKNVAGGTTTIQTCQDPGSDHISVPERNLDWVTAWIDAKLTGAKSPACAAPTSSTCPGLPPNL